MNLLIKETVLQRIMRKTGRNPCQCKCSLCREQSHILCLGTPEDIEKIIDAGYGDKLEITNWAVGIIMGVTKNVIPMLQARADNEYCVFFNDELCQLHDKGLKPTEGRLSHHSTRIDKFKASKSNAMNEEVLKIVLNDKTFSQREAETIVGSHGRLFDLVGKGAIRAEKKPTNRQNGRWYCNAYDVLKYDALKY